MSQELKNRALRLVLNCVRNTHLENLHAGVVPGSKTGDYSDVKVVSPYGEIPWKKLSRLNDEEMKTLMIEIVNKVYSFFVLEKKLNRFFLFQTPTGWNEPELDKDFVKVAGEIDEDEATDPASVLSDMISNWSDYSSDPIIYEHLQYHRGVLSGLIAAGVISFHESQSVWIPKIMKRKDTLLALRLAIKRKELKSKDRVDIQKLESGDWVGVDYDGEIQTEKESWEALQHKRENFTLIPAGLAGKAILP